MIGTPSILSLNPSLCKDYAMETAVAKDFVSDNSHQGEVLDEPLLLGGSHGRGRPRKFTFFQFLTIPFGPNSLPIDLRTCCTSVIFFNHIMDDRILSIVVFRTVGFPRKQGA